ncbi:MAG: TfuA domain-containing protein [Kofleriaceae bacterium]
MVHGPIAVGDLLALAQARRRPGCVAILDGYFERMAAVWHKEILLALERGVAVWGASSMGALRAAELAPWGMVGVGQIYQAFVRGQLSADDEVAVAHLSAEHGYRPTSDALVNLRDGLARAVRAGVLSRRAADTLVASAQARPYRERSWPQLLTDGAALGVPARARARLTRWLAAARPDRKAADARLLLRRLATHGWQRPAAIAVPRTWALAQLQRLLAEGALAR